jgi:hypothetical protein
MVGPSPVVPSRAGRKKIRRGWLVGTMILEGQPLLPEASDPRTGGRQPSELTFEVCCQQSLSVPTSKARELIRRGIRRAFCLLAEEEETEGSAVKRPLRQRRPLSRVLEWSRERNDWGRSVRRELG